MRISQALGSLPNLRRHLAPTARSRLSRGRLQQNVSTAIERPALEVSWVNTKRGPVDQTPLAPLLTISVIRTLVAGLILVALIPNLTLGAIFWLGLIDTPWSRPATQPPNESSMPAAQYAVPSPVLSSPTALEASAGGDITFPIALDGTDGVPDRSIIAIKGLPQGSKLSSGRPYDETEWNLKPDEIGDLHIVLPSNASGEAKLILQLVAPDGAIIADAATVLRIPGRAVGGAAGTVTNTAASAGNTAGGALNSTAHSATNVAGAGQGATGGLNATGQLMSNSRGVFGMQGVNLNSATAGAAQGSVITSAGKNLHLDSGTQMLLVTQAAGSAEAPKP